MLVLNPEKIFLTLVHRYQFGDYLAVNFFPINMKLFENIQIYTALNLLPTIYGTFVYRTVLQLTPLIVYIF